MIAFGTTIFSVNPNNSVYANFIDDDEVIVTVSNEQTDFHFIFDRIKKNREWRANSTAHNNQISVTYYFWLQNGWNHFRFR